MLLSAILTTCVQLGALSGEASYLAGNEAERAAKYGDAVQAYTDVVEHDQYLKPYAEIMIADCRGRAGDKQGAVAAYLKVIADYPNGPWVAMAKGHLAEVLHGLHNYAEAAPLYDQILTISPQPWWLDDYRWDAGESLVANADYAVKGYGIYRNVIENDITIKNRVFAAERLLNSTNPEDRGYAILGLLRSGKFTDAVKAVLSAPVQMPLENGQSLGVAQLSALLSTGTATDASATLASLAAANKGNIWLRIVLSQASRLLAEAGLYAQADQAATLLVDQFSDTRDAGDALWWLGRFYRDKNMTTEAIAVFRMLIEKTPDHFASDDAQMTIAKLFESKGQKDTAIQELLRLGELFPDSRLAAYSYYHAAEIAQGEGKTTDSRKYLNEAAETGIMDYYAHRALDKLLPAGTLLVPNGRNLKIDGKNPVLQTVPGMVGLPVTLPDNWEQSPQMARLRFFGAHGLEAGEWEAMDILKQLSNSSEHEALYQAVADAGFAHTALQFAEDRKWGYDSKGEKTVARLRLELPRAYWPTVTALARETGVDPYLILAVAKQESTYRATVMSHAGATGVMQLMPKTADWMATVEPAIANAHANNLKSPENSIRLGAYYLKRMKDRSDLNLVYAVASYNGGPGNVDKWRRQFAGRNLDQFVEEIPFDETRMYVKKVLGYYAAYHSLYPAWSPS